MTDERMRQLRFQRYNFAASSAVIDGVQKHSPCPLMTTTGMQRKPGVQVRLVAGSPKASRHSHLNPGFKVVFARIDMAEDAFFPWPRAANLQARASKLEIRRAHENPRKNAGFSLMAKGGG